MAEESPTREDLAEGLPERIGKYKPLSQLGVGGMGVVYRALDPDGHLVALKVIRSEHAADPVMQRRFIREASGGARLYHPHIVRFLDFGIADGLYFIAMELIEGVPLWDWIPHAPAGDVVHSIISQILSALAYAHARGVIHRDLKPENVLIETDRYGEVSARLMDFGIVHFRDESLASQDPSNILGTPEYLSPEQAVSPDLVTPASDIYAVGILIWELLTGSPPYSASTPIATIMAHVEGPRPMFIPRKEYAVDGPIESVLDKFLAREPEDRFAFANDAQRAFRECRIRGGVPIEELPWKDTGSRERNRQRAIKPSPGIYAISEAPYQNVRPELHAMREFAEGALREGQVRFIILSGAPGVGKSRLLRELCGELEEAGLMQAWTGNANAAGNPVVAATEALQRGFGIYGLEPERARERLTEAATRQGIEDPYEIEAFIDLIQGYDMSAESKMLRSQEARIALFSRVLARARRKRPVIIGLDGLVVSDIVINTWTDFIGRDELDDFCAVAAYCVRATRREEIDQLRQFVDGVKRSRRSRHLFYRHIEPLPVRSLQRIIVGSANVHPNVATGIASHASGNPRDALEMVRNFSELAGVDIGSDVDNVGEVLHSLPHAAAELTQRRLESLLSAEDAVVSRRILEVLACYDVGVSYELAAKLIHYVLPDTSTHDIDVAITGAAAAGVLEEPKPGFFRFSSPTVRESFAERLSVTGEFREVTRTIADFEGEQDGPRTFLRLVRLAERYRVGGDDLKAYTHFLEAGNKAAREGRLHEARMTLERALKLMENMQDSPSAVRDAAVLHSLARIYTRQGLLGDALDLIDRVRVDEMPVRDKVLTSHWLVRAEWARHQALSDEAEALFQRALKAAILSGQRKFESGVRIRKGLFALEMGRLPEAEVQIRGALAARGPDESEFYGTCLVALGFVALCAGAVAEAQNYIKVAEPYFTTPGSRNGLATSALLEGELHYRNGAMNDALDAYNRSRRLFDEVGGQRDGAIVQLHRARALAALESIPLARASLDQGLEALKKSRNHHWVALGTLIYARIEATQRNWDASRIRLVEALRFDTRSPINSVVFTEELVAIARLWVFSGDYETARELLERCSSKLARIGASTYLCELVDEVEYLLHTVK